MFEEARKIMLDSIIPHLPEKSHAAVALWFESTINAIYLQGVEDGRNGIVYHKEYSEYISNAR